MKLVLILLGLLLVQPVWAEWVETAKSENGVTTFYFDQATVRKTPDGRRAWTMASYKEPRQLAGITDLFARAVYEFDCIGERARPLKMTMFSEPMLGGSLTDFTGPPGDWAFVAPGTMLDGQLKAVCEVPLPK